MPTHASWLFIWSRLQKKNNIETTENDLKIEQITKSNNANKQV